MVTQIVEQLRQAAAQDHQEFPAGPDLHPPPGVPQPSLPPPVQEPAPIANAVVHTPAPAPDPIMAQLLAQMQQMQQQMIQMQGQNQNQNPNQDQNQNRGERGGRGRNQNGYRGNPQRGRCQYCWTHGSCAHSGAECETTSQWHIATATFANKQNGSTRNC